MRLITRFYSNPYAAMCVSLPHSKSITAHTSTTSCSGIALSFIMHCQVTETCTVCFLGAVPDHAHQRTTDNHHYLNAVQDQGTHTGAYEPPCVHTATFSHTFEFWFENWNPSQ